MTKKIDDWLDDVPENNENDEDDEIIWVSKSEIKRDAEALKDLGAEMVDLGKTPSINCHWTKICAPLSI